MASHTLESLNRQVVEGNQNRRHFERTPEQMANAILEESRELVDEINTSMLTGEVVPVVGEIGDLYILLAQLCDDLGIKPEDAMDYKIKRNQYKYPDHTMNNGYSRERAFFLSKAFYREFVGGDEAFSHAYLEVLADVPDHEEPQSSEPSNQHQPQEVNGSVGQPVKLGRTPQVIFPPSLV